MILFISFKNSSKFNGHEIKKKNIINKLNIIIKILIINH